MGPRILAFLGGPLLLSGCLDLSSPAGGGAKATPPAVLTPFRLAVGVPARGEAVVAWDPVPGAVGHDLYQATDPSLDPGNWMGLPDGARYQDPAEPLRLTGLRTGVTYYFLLGARMDDGSERYSPVVSGRILDSDRILPSTPWWSEPGAPYDQMDDYGKAVAGGGDVDGDGRTDVAVGEPSYLGGAIFGGRVQLFSGASLPGSNTPVWVWPGPANSNAGASLAFLDAAGDGFADLAVGASSAIYVFRGGPGGLPGSPTWTLSGVGGVMAVGDFNCDGYADLAATSRETVEVFAGGPAGLSTSATWTLAEPGGYRDGDGFGASLAALDFNGDGCADLAVGTPGRGFVSGPPSGVVYLYPGSRSGLSSSPAAEIDPPAPSVGEFGYPIFSAGDVNGDGFEDLLVTAPVSAAVAWLVEGQAILTSGITPAWSLSTPGGNVTSAVAIDLDGDGFGDLVLSADFGTSEFVAAYRGGPQGLAQTAFWSLPIAPSNGNAGAVVASASNVDGQGLPDLLFGLPNLNQYLPSPPSTVGGLELFNVQHTGGPSADAGSPGDGKAPLTWGGATFTDLAEDPGRMCSWDWGDGATDTLPACTPAGAAAQGHTYSGVGYYTLRFRVDDSSGFFSEGITTIRVDAN